MAHMHADGSEECERRDKRDGDRRKDEIAAENYVAGGICKRGTKEDPRAFLSTQEIGMLLERRA